MHRRSGGPSDAEASALLVRGGTLVTPQGTWRADVHSRGGRIVEVGPGLEADGQPVLDAGGALVFPGIIDPHLHFALVAAPHRTADISPPAAPRRSPEG